MSVLNFAITVVLGFPVEERMIDSKRAEELRKIVKKR